MFINLINSVALLLALSLLQAFISRLLREKRSVGQIASGILFGGICIVGMMNPITLAQGAIFDGRSVILSMVGLYCGPLASVIALVIAGGYRMWLGGVGAGIGVAVVISSVLLGLAYRHYHNKGKVKTGLFQFLIFGFIVQSVAVLLFTLFPTKIAGEVMSDVALPFIIIFTFATAILGLLLQDIEDRIKTEVSLIQSEARYSELFENGAVVMLLVDPADGSIVNANAKACSYYGWDKAILCSMRICEINTLPPDQIRTEMMQVMEAKRGQFTFRHRLASGEIRAVEVFTGTVAIGGRQLILSSILDITEKRRAEDRLQLTASVFSHAREGIMITDALGAIIEVNDTFTQITGFSREEALGQNPRILKSGLHGPEFYKDMWDALFGEGYWSGEIWNRRKDGEPYAALLTISAVRDIDGKIQNYVALFTDITRMKEHEQRLVSMAHYDTLTGLPNRALLADRLQQAMIQSQRRNSSVAVAYLDLDGFKDVNDNHGHDVGDKLLIALSERMKAAIREVDTLARMGGDEFVIVLLDLEQHADCESALVRLLQAVSAPIAIDNVELQISASIGVTLYPRDQVEADHLLRHADQAMYVAKQAGKNRYHLFDVDQEAELKNKLDMVGSLQRALDQSEFILHYQPKVNMRSGKVIGAEALVRWQHPSGDLMPPAAFLPFIENHKIGADLDEWVIDTVLAQMEEWQSAGLSISVSVNVGARLLQQDGFAQRLAELLATHPDVQPHCLELEVLETSALEDMAKVSEIMHACRHIGVQFSLDDFGTGYSALTYLKRLPAEILKIDQSFVRDMLEDEDDLAIVEGVLGLAAAFRRSVIAEGVETAAHGEILLALGCELAQGYAIARPMPASDLPDWIKTWRPDASWLAWRDRLLNQDDRIVIYTQVRHRHWLLDIEGFLTGDREQPPSSAMPLGHFDYWMKNDGRMKYGNHSEFWAIADLHERLHLIGRDVVEMRINGQTDEARAHMSEVHALLEELIARLRGLVKQEWASESLCARQ